MKAKEYLEKNYGQGHLQSVMQLDDILSIFALMDEFAEYKVKNCNATAVSKSISTEYAEFCVRCYREKLPLLCLDDYIKQYSC